MPFTELLSRIRDENLNVYRASPQRLREDVGQESQIAQDYRGRLIYELLQNADDALSSNAPSVAHIAFVLDDDALWVANSGRPLDEADVRGLCGISASSKSTRPGKRRASIGHKGMGFKSVLEISDAPEVYSTTVSFCFGPERSLQAVNSLVGQDFAAPVTRAPVTRFPWPVASEPAQWQVFRSQGMHTAFRFPLRTKMTDDQRIGLARALRELPVTSLVFLKHLSRVAVSIMGRIGPCSFAWNAQRQMITESGATDVRQFSVAGTYRVVLTPDDGTPEAFLIAHDPDIAIDGNRGGLDEFTWEGVELAEVSVAARIRDGGPVALEPTWKKLHVFLPTGEPCPYDLLVSGAFGTNLSRQEIRVDDDRTNYNRLLLQNAARLFRDVLVPRLLASGASTVDVLKLIDRGTKTGQPCGTAAAQALFEETRRALRDLAFLPQEVGDSRSIAESVVPPVVTNPVVGREFRRLLPPFSTSGKSYFPATQLCGSDIARILVDHGANELSSEEAAAALARSDPTRSQLEIAGKIFVDPVLRVLEALWLALDGGQRESLANRARCEALFPIGIADDGTARRIATDAVTCFYPPRSLKGSMPLDGLSFLMQEICWGDLTPPERNQALKQEVAVWQALFDIQEFKFPAVMRASVLPALDLDRDAVSIGERKALHSLERIAAICQLSGRTPKASAPLPYERLGANRALFNLSRLDVPCRGANPGEFDWVPAYQAYLGTDWIGDNSVERVFKAARELGVEHLPSIHFLAGPEAFSGLLEKLGHLQEAPPAEALELGTDEVGLEEDEDSALESDERSRWLNFFQWLGVNQVLRPVHFHDVEDRASGWLKTANLQRPDGWIFKNIDSQLWSRYVDGLRNSLGEAGLAKDKTPYFYHLHDLEHLVFLLGAACRDATAKIGRALYEHLALNWSTLERFSSAVIAAIPSDNVPAMRGKPQRAKDDELVDAGPDFWMARLQASAFCPTGHGPRHAHQIWMPTREVERRFGRRGRTGSYLVPALDAAPAVLKGKPKGFAQALGIREELSPATFALDDAAALVSRLHELYAEDFGLGKDLRQELREVIRPAYRNLFELLSGHDQSSEGGTHGAPQLVNVLLLAQDGRKAFRFLDARHLYYLDRRDTRERLQSDVPIWSFVIDALPTAKAPLVNLFGVRVLEDAVEWAPKPGDAALIDDDAECMRNEIRALAPYLLARIAADRADERLGRVDAQRLRRLIDCLEAVSHLELSCRLDGRSLDLGSVSRDAFVEMESETPKQAFVVWGERPWPPDPREAEALANALCDVFGAGYFESFLALIQAGEKTDCERLLRRAGASTDIDEKRALFLGVDTAATSAGTDMSQADEPRNTIDAGPSEQPPVFPGDKSRDSPPVDVPRTPIFSPDQLLIDGTPILVYGKNPQEPANSSNARGPTNHGNGNGKPNNQGYGGHTDLDMLNRVGMWVAMSFERNRLRGAGLNHAEIFDQFQESDQPDALVFDVSTPESIACARKYSTQFDAAMRVLNKEFAVSPEWPGFDLLTLNPQFSMGLDRLIELKSSGVDSRIQEMSWNEWKAASKGAIGALFYLYLVGNLRSDLKNAVPYVRTIRNPFEQLVADVQVNRTTSRKVQLAVKEFREAEHLDLSVRKQARQ